MILKKRILIAIALILSLSTAFAQDDPCLSIAGKWTGQYISPATTPSGTYLGTCTFGLNSNFDAYKTIVSMESSSYFIGCSFPTSIHPELGPVNHSGTCQDAQLNLGDGLYTGVVINNKINLNSPQGVRITLHKSSNARNVGKSRKMTITADGKRLVLICTINREQTGYACHPKWKNIKRTSLSN